MDKSLLNRATNSDDTPTPGYLYGEIARMTQHSFETSQKVMEFLMTRVKKKNHNIKYKALQVIKHVCREGRLDFRREMQKYVPVIKECLQYQCAPDPLKGDEYYRRVRQAAKECLDAIFDTDANPSGMSGMGMASRIRGVGGGETNQPSGNTWGKFGWGGGSNSNSNTGPPIPSNDSYDRTYNAPGYGGDSQMGSGGYGGGNSYGGPGGYEGNSQMGGNVGGGYGGNTSGGYGGNTGGGYGNTYGGRGPNGPGGYGNDPSASSGYGNRMTGIGNPMYQDSREEGKGFFQGLKERFAKPEYKPNFAGPPPGSQNPPEGWSFANNRQAGMQYAPDYNGDEGYRGSSYGPPTWNTDNVEQHAQLREKSYAGTRKKGTVGGTWGNETGGPIGGGPNRRSSGPSYSASRNTGYRDRSDSEDSEDEGNDRGHQETLSRPPRGGRSGSSYRKNREHIGHTSGAASDGTYERGLISDLCTASGMRAVPPKDKLDGFLKHAMTLDADIVGPLLDECLRDSAWQVNSKALHVIEQLLKAPGCDAFYEYFIDYSADIENCQNSDKVAVRDRAIKVLHVLGLDENRTQANPSSNVSYRQSKQTQRTKPRTQPQTDLLGGFEDEIEDTNRSNGNSNSNSQVQSSNDLFAGLQQSPSTQTSTVSMSTVDQTASTSTPSDLFGGLQIGGGGISKVNFDPLLEPVSSSNSQMMPPAPTQGLPKYQQQHPAPLMMNPSNSNPMNPNASMMSMGIPTQLPPQMSGQLPPSHMPPMLGTPGSASGLRGRSSSSNVIGAPMTPSGIAKTIHDPSTEPAPPSASSSSGFGFMSQKDDSFSFIKDAMKNG